MIEELSEQDKNEIWERVDSKSFNTDLLDDINYMEYRMDMFEREAIRYIIEKRLNELER